MDLLKHKKLNARGEITTLFKHHQQQAQHIESVESEIIDAYCNSEDFSEADYAEDQDKALEYKQRWTETRSKYDRLTKQPPATSLTRQNNETS